MTIWSLAVASEIPDLKGVVDRLQKTYEQISGFQAEFHQKTFRQDGSLAVEARGTLSYQKPSQMRWDYNPPEEQQVIIDGKKLWIYYPKERQVLVQPLAEGLPSTPLYLLAGVAEFEKEFEISWSPPKEDGEGYHLQLKPKGEIPGVYQLVIDSKKYLISRMVSIDPIGYKTEWRFQRIQVAPSFSKDFFKFTPPKGVEIIQAP
jgi:outer membrane lipoprotein carrier protein